MTRSHEGIYADIDDDSLAVNQKITLTSWLKSLVVPASVGCFVWLLLSFWGSGKFGSIQKKREIDQQIRRLFSEGMEGLLQCGQNSESAVSNGFDSESSGGSSALFDLAPSAVSNIRSAFLLPLNGYFSKSSEALSASEINDFLDRFLSGEKNSEQVENFVNAIKRFFADLDSIRYGHESAVIEKVQKDAPSLFNEWLDFIRSPKFTKKMKASKPKKTRVVMMKTVLPFVIFFSISILAGCSARPDPSVSGNLAEIKRLEQEAEKVEKTQPLSDSGNSDGRQENGTKTAEAASKNKADQANQKRDLYLKTAALYQGIRDRGIESGSLLFNQGNAFYRAGEKAKALAAWRTAQRYRPSDPWLKANIELLAVTDPLQKKAVSEYFLFWQNKIGSPAKYQLAWLGLILSILFLLLWRAFAVRAQKYSEAGAAIPSVSFGSRRSEISDFSGSGENSPLTHNSSINENYVATTDEKELGEKRITENSSGKTIRKILRYGLLLSLIFFAVMSYSALYDWFRFDARSHGIVAVSEAVVRKGNSTRYEPVFKETLPELSETVILERRDTWCRIRLTDGQEGWLPQSDLVIY